MHSASGAVGLPTWLTYRPVFLARWGHISVSTAQSTGTGAPASWLGMEKEGMRQRTLEGSSPHPGLKVPHESCLFFPSLR